MVARFEISCLAIAGGTIAMCRMPGAENALEADIQALAALGVTCVLTLTPLAELAAAGAGPLPERLATHGMDWLHFPIDDFGTPRLSQQLEWDILSHDLRKRVDQGETVAIHCRAGLGRTGMIALRLMTETGEDPATALRRLRETRPGTVERQAQFDWAAQGLRRTTQSR